MKEIERRVGRGERMAVSIQAVNEAYAVLTRLPAPYRLEPGDAWALIEANFINRRIVIALGADEYVSLLRELAKAGVGGGRTYDAVIAAGARRAKATALLTFNRRHFESPADALTIIEPA